MQKFYPTLSIIVVTRNVENKLPHVLSSIAMQDYPREKIEIIAVDGGSIDQTLSLLKNSSLPIKIIRGKFPNDQEARRVIGLRHAKGEIVAYIDSDNYLPHKTWLTKMVQPLIAHPSLVGSFTLRYGYRKTDSVLNRYFALLGSADPVDHYLKKGERLSYVYDKWNRYGTIIGEHKKYILVQFDPMYFPTLGANGFLARRSIWKKSNIKPENSVHVDVAYDLAMMGHHTYAIVNDSIIHDTATTLTNFIKKRAGYIVFYMKRGKERKYKVFDPKRHDNILNLFLFMVYSLTIVQPLIFASRGFIKKRDFAWFMHPVFCFSIAVSYTGALIFAFVTNRITKTNE